LDSRRDGIQPDRVDTNSCPPQQENTEAFNATALANAPSQDTYHVEVGTRVDPSVCFRLP